MSSESVFVHRNQAIAPPNPAIRSKLTRCSIRVLSICEVHTAYSLSEGAIKLPKLVELCREHDMPAVAVTDTNNLFGALEFALAASRVGIQPIIGTQIDIAREGEAARKSNGKGR